MYTRRPYTFDRVVRIIFSLAGTLIALYLLNLLKSVLLPFFVACLIAYILEPLVKWNMRITRLKRRFVPVIMTLIEAIIIVCGFCAIFIPYLVNECTEMAEMVHKYATTQINIPFISQQVHDFIRDNIDFEKISRMLTREEWQSLARKTLSSSWTVISSSITFLISAISWCIVFLYVIFIMMDYERLMLSFRLLIPHRHRNRVYSIVHDVEHTMNLYFRGQALIASIVGILFSIGFLIIGLPMGVVLGLFIGILNMVPYLQLISLPITALLCVVWTVSTGGDFWVIFAESMAVYIVVQVLQDMIITPKVMGKAMGLNPAIILLALSVWGSLLGFMGLIIALPLTTLILSYYNMYVIDRYQDPLTELAEEIEDTPDTPDHHDPNTVS